MKSHKSNKAKSLKLTALVLLLSFLLLPFLSNNSYGEIVLEKDTYFMDEIVQINLTERNVQSVSIYSDSEYYKFLGAPDGGLKFLPKKAGTYTITAILDGNEQSTAFEVIQNDSPGNNESNENDNFYPSSNARIDTDKNVYELGEKVNITLDKIENKAITIAQGEDIFRYLGESNGSIIFVPQKPGWYDVIAEGKAGKIDAKASFSVIDKTIRKEETEKTNIEISLINQMLPNKKNALKNVTVTPIFLNKKK